MAIATRNFHSAGRAIIAISQTVEGILYVLTPVSSAEGSIAEKASLGWSKAFTKNSSLYHHLPGTPLQLRDDGKHTFVKVGDRESMYMAIEAQ